MCNFLNKNREWMGSGFRWLTWLPSGGQLVNLCVMDLLNRGMADVMFVWMFIIVFFCNVYCFQHFKFLNVTTECNDPSVSH